MMIGLPLGTEVTELIAQGRPNTTDRYAPRARAGSLIVAGWMLLTTANSGCFTSWLNGFLSPTELGQFSAEPTTEIRPSISELEDPALLSGSTDPIENDLRVVKEVPAAEVDDAIVVRIFELLAPGTETTEQKLVQHDGTIYLPVLGWIHVEGLTGRQIQDRLIEITQQRNILRNPEISVNLIKSQQKVFHVFGFVQRPGTFSLIREDIRLLEALNFAGGLPENGEWIYIYRQSEIDVPPGAAPPAGGGPTTGSAPWTQPTSTSDSAPASGAAFDETVWIDAPQAGQTDWLANELRWSDPALALSDVPQDQEVDPALLDAASPVETRPASLPSDEVAAPAPELTNWIFDPATGEWKPAPDTSTTAEAPVPQTDLQPGWQAPQDLQSQPGSEPSVFAPIVAQIEEEYPDNRIIAVPAKPLRDGDPRYNLVVRKFDTIRVTAGEVGEYFMMGHVNRPGAYSLNGRKLTLKQALAAAGGMEALGWPDRCQIIRRIGEDREQVIQVNIDQIFAGRSPDMFLKANDIVNVGSHPVALFLAVIRSAFRFTYGFGFVYDRNFGDIDSFAAQPNPAAQEALSRAQRFPGLFP